MSSSEVLVRVNVLALEKGERFLTSLPAGIYAPQPAPGQSPIGKHMRHIIDLYASLIQGYRFGKPVDFTKRQRGTPLERDRERALERISRIKSDDVLQNISREETSYPMQLIEELEDETGIFTSKNPVTLGGVLARVNDHTNHHYAYMKHVAKVYFGHKFQEETFGVSPSTIVYERGGK